jgi:isoquinoline 1-oxidoreductase subunit beta
MSLRTGRVGRYLGAGASTRCSPRNQTCISIRSCVTPVAAVIGKSVSAALFSEITLKDGRVEQGNFHNYRTLRINEAPRVDVHLVKSTEAPGGIGEPGTSAVAPAVVNAIFAATGKRLCKLPVDPAQLRAT